MTVRVTAVDVKAIIDTELKTSVIDAYITSANTMVNNVLGTGTTDNLKEIERWLTAHMIALTKERQAIREEAGGTRVDYSGTFGEALKSTTYGQMVSTLDTSGKMASLAYRAVQVYAVPSFD
jgi:hypothetical protein